MGSQQINLLELDAWGENPVGEFEMKLDAQNVQLQTSLRHLPGRRLTCRASWREKMVIIKFFYGASFRRCAEKEKQVLKALIKSGIDTPALLSSHQHSEFSVLFIEYIDNAVTLSEWLKVQKNQVEFESMFEKVTTLMQACHRKGFEVKDPHLENFITNNGKVFIIDAGDIGQSNGPLNKENSLQNLTLLYAQLPITKDIDAYQVLKTCLKRVSAPVPSEMEWQKRLIKKRHWRQKKFIDKKVFRNCSAYICKQNRSRFLVAKRDFYTDDVAQALSSPDALIKNGLLLKDGKTATVTRVNIAGQAYVLKRYNIKKSIYAIVRGLRWSRAASSWKNGLLLEMLGIPTAASYVLIEERWGALRRRSYLLSEFVDAPQAWDVFGGDTFSDQSKKEWAIKIHALFELLKRSQISHGDLKAQNILCPKEGAIFIDLDGMQFNQSYNGFLRQFEKDIQRFQRSWMAKDKVSLYFNEYFRPFVK